MVKYKFGFIIICGLCGKEREDHESDSIEAAIRKAVDEGWLDDALLGLICPSCVEANP
ncbi:MAG: hypothetical protein GWN61_01700 [candidate division Zixibacteria bacterium]|nr:hypothetical protein [candidate division Zixibacteria bacterium]NIS44769.1 hypothetical protein [candidate division Zixibacteria bacterium]NIU12860.1 hypothetical protein [candidate division Zixibacteria bacterium]NIV04938.1 hypothetical protein [candidate division Zixibacteria bacterium]NIX54784.1 hypothetical protein [candidate division Zixibacteria bacterium]